MQENNGDITEQQLDNILTAINDLYGYDFTNYAKASMHRRVTRFMHDSGFKTAEALRMELVKDKSHFDFFLQRVTVNVTEMFRDPAFYKSLKEQVFPVLATYPVINVWHAGCSSGEEVFSTAIFLHEAGLLQRCRIYATDINPNNIQKAKKGI
ncbi:MAG TPA: CheR family methyltransferase, partial [Segetibacter sp.]